MLESRYNHPSRLRTDLLLSQFRNVKQGDQLFSTYLAKFNNAYAELRDSGYDMEKVDKSTQFTLNLHKDFVHFKDVYSAKWGTSCPLEEVLEDLEPVAERMELEKRLKKEKEKLRFQPSDVVVNNVGFSSNNKKKSSSNGKKRDKFRSSRDETLQCTHCGHRGHEETTCRYKGKQDVPRCNNCKKLGHVSRNCKLPASSGSEQSNTVTHPTVQQDEKKERKKKSKKDDRLQRAIPIPHSVMHGGTNSQVEDAEYVEDLDLWSYAVEVDDKSETGQKDIDEEKKLPNDKEEMEMIYLPQVHIGVHEAKQASKDGPIFSIVGQHVRSQAWLNK